MRYVPDKQCLTVSNIRSYLKTLNDLNPYTYANNLKALKRFFRDFMQMSDLVESFKFPHIDYEPIVVPTKQQLRRFYDALKTQQERTLFLLYASSGLRRNEALTLTVNDLDFKRYMVIPRVGRNKRGSKTKRDWVTFYNDETAELLDGLEYNDQGLFEIPSSTLAWRWSQISKQTSIHISPTVLREWFCSEMGELGVPDRYIDAFCGRVPKSVLARHYTDYSPERLKRIYDRADLKVLS